MLPDLLRDLGGPFPAIWEQFHPAHGPREAARIFAKIMGQLETHGAAVVVQALTAALAAGTPLLLALTPATTGPACIPPEAVPLSLRTILARTRERRQTFAGTAQTMQPIGFFSRGGIPGKSAGTRLSRFRGCGQIDYRLYLARQLCDRECQVQRLNGLGTCD